VGIKAANMEICPVHVHSPCGISFRITDAERVNVVLGIYKHYPGSIFAIWSG
jgi:uncharacterized membrane protein YqaE (UPF0057 family)